MKLTFLVSLVLLVSCSEKSDTEKVKSDFITSESGQFNIVVFYEGDLPSKTFQNEINKSRDFLLDKGKLDYLYYVDLKSRDIKYVFDGLKPPHAIIFDHEGARVNATKPELLYEQIDSLLDK